MPDPQPPAPEGSVDALVKTMRECMVTMENMPEGLAAADALAARLRDLEATLPLLRSELDWCIGYAATAEHEAWGERLLKRLHVARALLGSGEGQEAG